VKPRAAKKKRRAEVACARRSDEGRPVGGKATGRNKAGPGARRPETGTGLHEGLATSRVKASRVAGVAGLSRGTAARRSWRSSMGKGLARERGPSAMSATEVSEVWSVKPEREENALSRAFTGPPKRSAAS